MALSYRSRQRLEALVLQACFASVGTPLPPSEGEIVKFVNKWGEGKASAFQVARVVSDFTTRGFLEMKTYKRGRQDVRRYTISVNGTYYLLASVHHLPKQIMVAMSDLAHRVSIAATNLVNEYLSQGVING